MGSYVVFFFACVCVACVRSQSGSSVQCSTSKINAPKVIVSSRQDQTGHWISKVGFKNGNAENMSTERSKTHLWSVEIDHNLERCYGLYSNLDMLMTFTARPQRVDSSYELFPGVGYYKFHSKVETWPRAREICESEGAHLAIINSEKEAEVLQKIFTRFPILKGANDPDWAWIGLYEKKSQPGQYYTIFEEHVNTTGFTRWGPGQPSIVGTGAYMLIHRQTGGIGDTHTNYVEAFFCEQELW